MNCRNSFPVLEMETGIYIQICTTSKAITKVTVSIDGEETSYELWCFQKPIIRHVRVWGCTTYMMVLKERRRRFNDRAIKYMFVGYIKLIKYYHCLEPKTRKEHVIQDVVLHKFTLYYKKEKEKLQRLSPSSSKNEKSCKSESEQE